MDHASSNRKPGGKPTEFQATPQGGASSGAQIRINGSELPTMRERLIRHIERMLESSRILMITERYLEAIPLLVIIHEEMTKLRLASKKWHNASSITEREWKEVNGERGHMTKLTRDHKAAHEAMKMASSSELARWTRLLSNFGISFSRPPPQRLERDLSWLRSFNKIKQLALYFDWKNQELTLDALADEDVRHLAVYLFTTVAYQVVMHQISFIYQSDVFYRVPVGASVIRKDPLWTRMKMIALSLNSVEYHSEIVPALDKIRDALQHVQEPRKA